VLFVHGLCGGAWMWDRFVAVFARSGWDGWSLTRRGQHRGGSDVSRRREAAQVAADVCGWLARVLPGLDALVEPEGLAQEQPVADAALAHGQRPEAGHRHELLQHHGARHDDIRAPGLQTAQTPSTS
jgi:hypothetical protein